MVAQQKFLQFRGAQAECFDIHPHQVCAFEAANRQLRQVAATVVGKHVVIAFEVRNQLFEPFLAFGIGGDCADYSEGIYIAYLVDIYCAVDACAEIGIAAYNRRDLQPCSIEGLARRNARNRMGGELIGQCTVGCVLIAGVYQLAMNLVADHYHAVVAAYAGEGQ